MPVWSLFDRKGPKLVGAGGDLGGQPLITCMMDDGYAFKSGEKLWNGLTRDFEEIDKFQSSMDQALDENPSIRTLMDLWKNEEMAINNILKDPFHVSNSYLLLFYLLFNY